MRVYEYAKKRNVRSRDVVKKCHELGMMTVKNHLSLIPLKRIHELDQIDFAPKHPPFTRRKVFILCFDRRKRHPVLRQVIRSYQMHRDAVFLLQPQYGGISEGSIERVVDVVIHHQWLKVSVYRIEKERIIRFFIDMPDRVHALHTEREKLEAISILYQVAISLLEDIPVDQVVGIDWPCGLFPLTFKRLNRHAPIDFHFYLSTINYEGIYDLNDLNLFFLDFRDKDTVEYAGSLNFLKAGLLSYSTIHFLNDAENQLKASYLRDYYYEI